MKEHFRQFAHPLKTNRLLFQQAGPEAASEAPENVNERGLTSDEESVLEGLIKEAKDSSEGIIVTEQIEQAKALIKKVPLDKQSADEMLAGQMLATLKPGETFNLPGSGKEEAEVSDKGVKAAREESKGFFDKVKEVFGMKPKTATEKAMESPDAMVKLIIEKWKGVEGLPDDQKADAAEALYVSLQKDGLDLKGSYDDFIKRMEGFKRGDPQGPPMDPLRRLLLEAVTASGVENPKAVANQAFDKYQREEKAVAHK